MCRRSRRGKIWRGSVRLRDDAALIVRCWCDVRVMRIGSGRAVGIRGDEIHGCEAKLGGRTKGLFRQKRSFSYKFLLVGSRYFLENKNLCFHSRNSV